MPRKNTQKKKKSTGDEKKESISALNLPIALQLKKILVNLGYKGLQLEFLLVQAAHESAGFYKDKAIENSNYGGVKWNKQMRGLAPSANFKGPKGEDHGIEKPYVHFKSMEDFAEKWPRVSHLNDMRPDNDIGAPLAATTLEEYEHRLSLNAYHQENSAVYLGKLKKWDVIVKRDLLQDSAFTSEIDQIKKANGRYVNDSMKVVPNPPSIPKTNDLRHDNNSRKTDEGLYKINSLLDLQGQIKAGFGVPEIMNTHKGIHDLKVNTAAMPQNVRRSHGQSETHAEIYNGENENETDIDLYSRSYEMPLSVNMQRAFGGNIQNALRLTDWERQGTGNNKTLIFENSDVDESADIPRAAYDENGEQRKITLNLNAPIIGQLSIHTKDGSTAMNDLRQQVEDVLLEVLDMVST